MRASQPAIAAAAVLALEALALAVIALMQVFALGADGTSSMTGAVALIVLTLVGAAAIGAFAIGTLRRASWARSGGIFVQVLGIALVLAALGVEPKPWPFIAGIGGIAVIGLVLLIAATRRDGASDSRLQRREADDD